MKITLNEITKALEAENYIADESVVYTVYTALTMELYVLILYFLCHLHHYFYIFICNIIQK